MGDLASFTYINRNLAPLQRPRSFFYSVESLSPVYQQFHILVMNFIQSFRYMYSCKSVRNCSWMSLAQKCRLLSLTVTRLILEVGITGSSIEDLDDVQNN